ncbi:MAG: ABC transporter permease [Anaerolineae bacterium]|nr:ABC transporter permease [Anaerolineae bacterium]
MRKLLATIWKDLYLNYTDRMALMLNLAAPFLISLVIGMAFGGMGVGDISISEINVIVVNEDQGSSLPDGGALNLGDQLVEFFVAPPSEELDNLLAAQEGDDWAAARALVEDGESGVVAAVRIPADFSQQVTPQGMAMTLGQGTVELYHKIDAPISSTVVESILTGWANRIATGSITTKVGIEKTVERLGVRSMGVITELTGSLEEAYTASPITLETQDAGGARQTINPISVVAPGLAILFLTIGLTFAAGQLITEKQQWTLQRMIATPTPRVMILAGKMAATFLSGVLQMAILLVATAFVGANWGKDYLAIVLLTLAAVWAATGLGALFASLVTKPEQLGVYGSGVMMVLGALAGTFTSTGFLGDAQFLSQLTLNWWGIEGFTALALGDGLVDIAPHLLVLTLMGAVYFVIGVWRFNRRLEF